MDVYVPWDVESHKFGPEVLCAAHNFLRNDLLLEDPLLVVHVVEEQIQGHEPLDKTALNMLPLIGGNDTRDQIEWENSLSAFIATVNGEGDPLIEIGFFGQKSLAIELAILHLRKAPREALIMRAHYSARGEHLIEEISDLVFFEQPVHFISLPMPV